MRATNQPITRATKRVIEQDAMQSLSSRFLFNRSLKPNIEALTSEIGHWIKKITGNPHDWFLPKMKSFYLKILTEFDQTNWGRIAEGRRRNGKDCLLKRRQRDQGQVERARRMRRGRSCPTSKERTSKASMNGQSRKVKQVRKKYAKRESERI